MLFTVTFFAEDDTSSKSHVGLLPEQRLQQCNKPTCDYRDKDTHKCTNTQRTAEIKSQRGEKRDREGGQRVPYRPPLPSASAVTAIKPSGGEERGQLCRKSGVRPAAVSATKLGAPLRQIERELL